jgi:hypothetical protein
MKTKPTVLVFHIHLSGLLVKLNSINGKFSKGIRMFFLGSCLFVKPSKNLPRWWQYRQVVFVVKLWLMLLNGLPQFARTFSDKSFPKKRNSFIKVFRGLGTFFLQYFKIPTVKPSEASVNFYL